MNASRQVWLAAFIPDGEHSLLDELGRSASELFNPAWIGQDPTVDHVSATYFLFHDCDHATLRWALTTLAPFVPMRLYDDVIALAPRIPSTYIVCADDRTIRPQWCRAQAERRLGAEIIEIDTGHCPHVAQPGPLATILAGLTG